MTRQEKIKEFLDGLESEMDLGQYATEELNSFDDLRDAIEDENGFDQEIIYHATAMEYLLKNDPSLRESCGLAADMGFETKNINAELLASILATQNCREEFEGLEDEINDFFTELNETEA